VGCHGGLLNPLRTGKRVSEDLSKGWLGHVGCKRVKHLFIPWIAEVDEAESFTKT
jgi:hypothetical protein